MTLGCEGRACPSTAVSARQVLPGQSRSAPRRPARGSHPDSGHGRRMPRRSPSWPLEPERMQARCCGEVSMEPCGPPSAVSESQPSPRTSRRHPFSLLTRRTWHPSVQTILRAPPSSRIRRPQERGVEARHLAGRRVLGEAGVSSAQVLDALTPSAATKLTSLATGVQ